MRRYIAALLILACTACERPVVIAKESHEMVLECVQQSGLGTPDILHIAADGKHAENLTSTMNGTVETTAAEYVFIFYDGSDQFVIQINRYTHLGTWELRPHGQKVMSSAATVMVKCDRYKGDPL